VTLVRRPATLPLVLLALSSEAPARLERLWRPPLSATVVVNTHYGAPREPLEPTALARLAVGGVRWIRNDLDWASVERTPGVYDFVTPGFDALVAAAEAAELHKLREPDLGDRPETGVSGRNRTRGCSVHRTGDRHAAAGEASAAQRVTRDAVGFSLTPPAVALPQRTRLTFPYACRAGFAGRGTPFALCTW
jgi:hypothetical protein